MPDDIFEIEADSLNAARQLAQAKLSTGIYLHSEQVLSDGSRTFSTAEADTVERAFRKARNGMPNGAVIKEEIVRSVPAQRVIDVEAFSEASAKLIARRSLVTHERIEALKLTRSSKPGFLGMGKKPALYEVEVVRPAVVCIQFISKPRIRVRIGTGAVPTIAFCQNCGRDEAPFKRSDNKGYFFCRGGCEESYFKRQIAVLLFSPNRLVLNASGQDISSIMSSGQELEKSAMAYCWYCGSAYLMREKKCGKCDRPEELILT